MWKYGNVVNEFWPADRLVVSPSLSSLSGAEEKPLP